MPIAYWLLHIPSSAFIQSYTSRRRSSVRSVCRQFGISVVVDVSEYHDGTDVADSGLLRSRDKYRSVLTMSPAYGKGEGRWRGALTNAAMRPSFVHLSVLHSLCLSVPMAQKWCILGLRLGLLSNTNRKPHMPEVKPTDQRSRNGNEADAGAVSGAFSRWLHHRYAPIKLPSAGACRFAAAISCDW